MPRISAIVLYLLLTVGMIAAVGGGRKAGGQEPAVAKRTVWCGGHGRARFSQRHDNHQRQTDSPRRIRHSAA